MIRSAIILFGLLSATLVHASSWEKAGDASISFKGTYQGEAFEGRFERFNPTIVFDPAAPGSARFDVEIDISSAKTGIDDYDSSMQDAEFFDGKRFPVARFVTKTFRKKGDDTYEADAELTIRDKTVQMVFPFRFVTEGGGARLTSTVTLKRLDFDVGTGDWTDTSLIANEVEVTVDLPLKQVP
jgi:polyisoprenoid-binding protein YceI